MRNPIAKLTVAAVLVAGVIVLVGHLTGHQTTQPEPKPYVAEQMPAMTPETPYNTAANELTQAKALYAQHDVTGLLSLLATGQYETKMKVAEYLGEIGGATALSALQSFAAQWQGDVDANPFQDAIDTIEERLAQPRPAQMDTAEPNSPSPEPNGVSAHISAAAESQTGVAGVVLDKLTQKPIAEALIGYQPYGTPNVVYTDTSGRFLLANLTPSEQQYVSVVAKGYASKRIVTRVVRDRVTENIRIEMDRGSRVAGTVTDSEGQPIAGASVSIWPFANRPMSTGPDGKFEIDGLSPIADTYTLRVAHPDSPGASLQFSPGAAGQTTYQDMVLTPGVNIYGRVTDPDGQPLSGVTVSHYAWNGRKDETDAQGQYRLEHVPLGEAVLWTVHPEHALHVERVLLTDGTRGRQIDIQLKTGVPLDGRIVDAGGAPVPNAQVVIQEYNGVSNLDRNRYTSDAEGRFTIAHAPEAGRIVLYPYGDGLSGELQKFELGRQECLLTVTRAGCIYGQVLGEGMGQPVPEFTVKLTSTEIGEQTHGYSATWAREGVTFRSPEGLFDTGQERLPVDAAYRMTVFAPGYDALTVDPVLVQPISEDPNRTVFRLKPATLIAGQVVDEQGHPVEGATVAVFSQSERDEPAHWRKFETDAEGIFVIAGAGTDQRYVYITAPGRAPYYCLKSDLEPADEVPAKVVLSPGSTIFGTVVDVQRRPVPGAQVRLRRVMDPAETVSDYPYTAIHKTARTDANGSYTLSDLPVGQCQLSVVSEAGDTLATKIAELTAGQSVQVDFGRESGFLVAGIVRRGADPVADVDVTLQCSDKSSRSARTDGAGRFSLGGVPSGAARVEISWDVQVGATGIQRQDLLNQAVVIDGDTHLDLDLGAGSIRGSLPPSLVGREGLHIGIRRWVEHPVPNHQGIANSWEYVPQSNRATQIDSEGSFHCSGLRAGRYCLAIGDTMRTLGITDVVELGEAQDLEGVTFRTGQGQLNIRVVSAETGQGLAAARFSVMNDLEWLFLDRREPVDGRNSRMETDAQGRAWCGDLPASRYQVSAWAFGYLPTSSQFVALSGVGARAVIVEMAPAAMATFEFSESLRQRVETDSIYVECRITDLTTGQNVPSLMLGFVSEEHAVSIPLEQFGHALGSVLHLPKGQYRIDYTLRPHNTARHVIEMAFYEGTATVELTTGQVQTVFLDD